MFSLINVILEKKIFKFVLSDSCSLCVNVQISEFWIRARKYWFSLRSSVCNCRHHTTQPVIVALVYQAWVCVLVPERVTAAGGHCLRFIFLSVSLQYWASWRYSVIVGRGAVGLAWRHRKDQLSSKRGIRTVQAIWIAVQKEPLKSRSSVHNHVHGCPCLLLVQSQPKSSFPDQKRPH